MGKLALGLIGAFAIAASVNSTAYGEEENKIKPHDKRSAVLWMTTSAEYDASSMQAYNAAAAHLQQAINNPAWTAATEQEGTDFSNKPKAIIVDLDESVWSNANFQAQMIQDNEDFNHDKWTAWNKLSEATPLAGAREFLQKAHDAGVEIFYVTNRSHKVEEATFKNLKDLGFPLTEGVDTLLTKKERKEWGSDKTSRRTFVAASHRILMLVGDDFNDFISGVRKAAPEVRRALAKEHADKWGAKWFMIPNPAYGSSLRFLKEPKDQYLKPFEGPK